MKNDESLKYKKEFAIHSYEVNRFGQASLCSIFNFLNEIAWEHAQVLNWGFEALKNHRLFWVLSRISVQIEKYPLWQEKIIVKTWPCGTDGMFAYREFQLENTAGEIIIRASSAWLILDLDTKRIFRLGTLRNDFPNLTEEPSIKRPERIKIQEHVNSLSFEAVHFTDIDINQHFNSVRFVERALNNIGIEFLDHHEVNYMEVNYLKEGLPDDRIAVSRVNISNKEEIISLVRESDQADLCIIKIGWKQRLPSIIE